MNYCRVYWNSTNRKKEVFRAAYNSNPQNMLNQTMIAKSKI